MKCVFVVLAGVLLSGCAGVDVHQQLDEAKWEQRCRDKPWACERSLKEPGIPFYIKVPRWVKETRYSGDEIRVRFEIVPAGKPKADPLFLYPPEGDVVLPPSAESEVAATKAGEQFVTGMARGTAGELEAMLRSIVGLLRAAAANNDPQRMIGNTCKQEMVVGPSRYYFEPKIPFMGSANHELAIAPDGTLTKVVSDVEDTTAQTLLAMLPIEEFFVKQWAITPPPPSPDPEESATWLRGLDKTLDDTRSPGEAEQKPGFEVRMKTSRTTLVYTLRKESDASTLCTDMVELEVDDALGGRNQTQLASIERLQVPAPKKEDPAYRFSGEVVPPKPKD